MRWPLVGLWVVVALAWWAIYIEPVVTIVIMRWTWIDGRPVGLHGLVRSIAYFWTKDDFSHWLPAFGMQRLLGNDSGVFRNQGHPALDLMAPSLLIVTSAVAAAVFVASPGMSRESMPARRPLPATSLAAAAMGGGAVVLAACCVLMAELDLYERAERLTFVSLGMNNVYGDQPTPLVFLAIWLLATVGCAWAMPRLLRRTHRYWQAERLSFVLVSSAVVVLGVSWAILLSRLTTGRYFDPLGYHSANLLGGCVLLSAGGARIAMLFRLRRYHDAVAAHGEHECWGCGYDLRATVTTDRRSCPECGMVVEDDAVEATAAPSNPNPAETP